MTNDNVRRGHSHAGKPERQQRNQFGGQVRHIHNLKSGYRFDSTPGLVAQLRRREELSQVGGRMHFERMDKLNHLPKVIVSPLRLNLFSSHGLMLPVVAT